AHYRREEEPAEPNVYTAGRAHQGHDHRGQRSRAWSGDNRRKGAVGQVRPDHKQPGERRLHQRAAP
ncbi:hypothetical protein IWW47_004366, partial [Coemansia sp. RSA 2052]